MPRVTPVPGTEDGAALLEEAARRHRLLTGVFTVLGLAVFFAYLYATVQGRAMLALPVGGSRGLTGAIALGLAALAGTIVLTSLYVLLDARYVDPLLERLRRRG